MVYGTVAFGTHLCENPLEPDWREPNFLPSPIDDVGSGWGAAYGWNGRSRWPPERVTQRKEGGLLLKWVGSGMGMELGIQS